MVSGVGYDRAAARGPSGRPLPRDPRRVVTNLAVLDFGDPGPPHAAACRCIPGSRVDDVVAATGFELVVPDDVPQTRLPTDEELALIRDVIDPAGLARRGAGVTRDRQPGGRCTRRCAPGCATCSGSDYPIVQTGMGWVSGARLTAATSRTRAALGILAAAR